MTLPGQDALSRLMQAHEAALEAVCGDATPIAAFFDHAVAASPEASVAAYSGGDPARLQAATAEIVAWLRAGGWLRDGADVLDLGCGIGRIAAGIAPHAVAVIGLDVSQGMVAEARRRCAAWPHLRFAVTPGDRLPGLAAASLDLLLAVDSFPYLVRLGVADAHVADAARALRPGGAIVILNLSYGRTPDDDRRDVQRWAAQHDLHIAVQAARPFTLWDGTAFVLHRGETA